MKVLIYVFALLLLISTVEAQSDTAIAKSGDAIEMLFPKGKSKSIDTQLR